MGHMRAMGFAEAVAEGKLPLDAALEYHLTVNHYPPIPLDLLPVTRRAVELAGAGEWDAEQELPSRCGGREVTVARIVEGLHLDAFVGVEAQKA